MGINKYTLSQLYRAVLQRHIGGGVHSKVVEILSSVPDCG